MSKSRWESDVDDDEPRQDKERSNKRQKKKERQRVVREPAPLPSSTPTPTRSTASILRSWIKPVVRSTPSLCSCRTIACFERLNHIEEGSYGVVFRARDRQTGDIVAIKRFKLDQEKEGFPITSLREIYTLMTARHPNIVNLREMVVSSPNSRFPEKSKDIFLVMDFVEHDLKTLMTDMTSPFLQSEVKTLMLQLLSAVALMHDHWIIHRDLKTSNLLLNNRGEIKVADFGLARTFGSPIVNMTRPVVTLWYRAPELLLGSEEYSTAIDMWSIGCIFAELINNEPLLEGRSDIDQISKVFKLLGTPDDTSWPGFSKLPHAAIVAHVPQSTTLRLEFPNLTEAGLDLLRRLLTLDPAQRITAEEALQHPYFSESPAPKDPSMFPTWPSKGSGEKKRIHSPSAPHGPHADEDEMAGTLFAGQASTGSGFQLKLK